MKHNYHLLSYSGYPFMVFCSVMGLSSSLVIFLKYGVIFGVFFGVFCLFCVVMVWCKDIFMEGLSGYHNFFVMNGFKYGMVFFIFSEFMFFFGVFWVFFDSSLVPNSELGMSWCPLGIGLINPLGVPLLNTLILLSSAVTVTWCHNSMLCNYNSFYGLFFTCVLALFFLVFQMLEYDESGFSMSDGIYGSIFYLSTGFHGMHVFFGMIFLFVNLFRLYMDHFNSDHHLGLEFSIVYWHFVDLIWLFLFVFVYWWSF
uniref:Cytochrome c oxidase subunit 3 n=48 Tax=Dracunculus medinensis TaxID=318479 RepID=G3LUG7_DRAME|nr:cytochrome c oxidase subunit III [Dracunculus medinensis]AEO27233.1 cytochrome c oxidase subunit III [Dracunculus medinensis]